MTVISAKIIADSKFHNGIRVTTFVLSYPRFIHSEFMTHRVFSRNAASSRAIPIQTMIERATKQTAMPVYWGKNQKGMQADEELDPKSIERAKGLWKAAAETMARYAQELAEVGVHKQITNRLIENFQNIEVVVTSTMWANFFALRYHPDAQPEIKELATQMLKAYRDSVPENLAPMGWHLPFLSQAERLSLEGDIACKVSAARCARVSYLTHSKRRPELHEDLGLFVKLTGGSPIHASPTEHQARAILPDEQYQVSNLGAGVVQFRKTLPHETVTQFEEVDR